VDVGVGDGHDHEESATDPLLVYHLCPLITYSSPSSTARVESNVGSEPAVLGSVMENALRSSPSSSGWSHWVRCPPGRHLDAHGEELGVARVRCVVAEHHRPVGGLAEDLVHEPSLTCPKPIPRGPREVRGHSPGALLLLEGRITSKSCS